MHNVLGSIPRGTQTLGASKRQPAAADLPRKFRKVNPTHRISKLHFYNPVTPRPLASRSSQCPRSAVVLACCAVTSRLRYNPTSSSHIPLCFSCFNCFSCSWRIRDVWSRIDLSHFTRQESLSVCVHYTALQLQSICGTGYDIIILIPLHGETNHAIVFEGGGEGGGGGNHDG